MNAVAEGRQRGEACGVGWVRLSTVQEANQIVVMEEGKIVDVGNHAQLMSQNGRYASLVRRQGLGLDPEDLAPHKPHLVCLHLLLV